MLAVVEKSIFVKMGEGIVVDESVEVHSVGEAGGVGSEPSAEGGIVKSSAVVDEVCFLIRSFERKTPGVFGGA